MKIVTARISDRKDALASEPFFQLLATPGQDDDRKLRFMPAMCSYVMSFRDLLRIIDPDDPRTPEEIAIHAYVQEDAPHYKWYLTDLATANYSVPPPEELWGAATLPSRRAIYRMIGYALILNPTPALKLTLISIFEATGEVFLRHTRMLMERLGMEDTLSYFGTKHYEDELSHSVGFGLMNDICLDERDRSAYLGVVDAAFDEYGALFQTWREAIEA
jgi:hypothetical protein